jgi:hypothetical protein
LVDEDEAPARAQDPEHLSEVDRCGDHGHRGELLIVERQKCRVPEEHPRSPGCDPVSQT